MRATTVLLSMVTDEFGSYRRELLRSLKGPGHRITAQEGFAATGTTTLEKLDDYVQQSDAVVHLVGDMTGSRAGEATVDAIRTRYPNFARKLASLRVAVEDGVPLSYTQWEAYLAVYHGKRLFIARPEPQTVRDPAFARDPEQAACQEEHARRLEELGRFTEIRFTDARSLEKALLRSAIFDETLRFAELQRDYTREVVDRLCRLDRVGFAVGGTGEPSLAASEAFAGQRFESREDSGGATVGLDALKGHRLVILGTGGAGKSSALKQLLARAARGASPRMPILVPLARLPSRGGLPLPRLLDHLARQAKRDLGFQWAAPGFFERTLGGGRAILGFDALDECGPQPRREQVRGLIEDAARQWPDCRMVVTSRLEAFELTPLRPSSDEQGGFSVFDLAPFARSDITPFLQVAFGDDGTLAAAILARADIDALLETPLTLTLLALVARSEKGVPSNRTDLFRSCIKTVGDTWEVSKEFRGGHLDVLWSLGWEAQRRGVDALTKGQAEAAIRRVNPSLVERSLEWLSRRSVVFRPETAPGSTDLWRLTFTHLQFREYLAGAYVAHHLVGNSRRLLPEAAGHVLDPGWLDVFRFTAGTVRGEAEAIETLLTAVLSAPDPFRDLLYRPELIAGRLLAELDLPDTPQAGPVVRCLERLARDEPALSEDAARVLLALWRHSDALGAIGRWARGADLPAAFAVGAGAGVEGGTGDSEVADTGDADDPPDDSDSAAFVWQLHAIQALWRARGLDEVLPLLVGLRARGVEAQLAVREAQAQIGDTTGAVAGLRALFESSPSDWERIGDVMDRIGATAAMNGWLAPDIAAADVLDIQTAKLARERGVLADTAPHWTILFERAASDLAALDPHDTDAADTLRPILYEARDLYESARLPAARALLTASLWHRSLAWYAGGVVRALMPELRGEVVGAMTAYVMVPPNEAHDSRYESALHVLCDEPDDALTTPPLLELLGRIDILGHFWVFVVESLQRRGLIDPGLAALRNQVALPPGVDDRNPDGQAERRSRALSAAERLAPGSTQVWLDSLYRRDGDQLANARRLMAVWDVSGVGTIPRFSKKARRRRAPDASGPDVSRIMDGGAVARAWFEAIAGGADGRAFLEALAAHAGTDTFGELARLVLRGEASPQNEPSAPAPTLSELESQLATVLAGVAEGHAGFLDVRPVLDAIRELAGPETANDYANRVVKASLPESGAVDAAAADTLVDCLDILSGTGFRDPEWLKLAATVARQITPVERVRLIGWIREHA